MKRIATKFVTWEVPELDTLKDSKVYQLRLLLNQGGKLDRSQKNWLTDCINTNGYFKRSVALRGYRFDFADVMKRYFVKMYGQVREYYACDKTALRYYLIGLKIDEIIEVKKR